MAKREKGSQWSEIFKGRKERWCSYITSEGWRLWIAWQSRDGRAWYGGPSERWALQSRGGARRYRCRLATRVPPGKEPNSSHLMACSILLPLTYLMGQYGQVADEADHLRRRHDEERERKNAKSISEEVDDGRRHPLLFTREPQPSSSWSWMEGRSNWSQWRPSGDLGFRVVDFFLLLLSSYFANKLNVNKETESLGASSSVMSVYKRERRKRTWQHFPSENRVPIEEKRRETFDYKNIKKWMQKRHWWWRLRRCTTSADCVSPEFSFLLSLFSLIRLSSSVFYLFSLLLQSYRCCDRINTPSLLQTGGSSSSCTALNYCAVYQSHQFFSLPLLLPCLNPAAAHRSNISLSLFNIKRFVRTEEKIYIRKPNGGGRLPHDETGRTGAITPIGSIGCCCWIVHSATQFRLLSCTPSLQLARGEAVRASTGALRLIS